MQLPRNNDDHCYIVTLLYNDHLLAKNWNILPEGMTEEINVSKFTHYFAESLSWYSLLLPKHSWTPLSAQSLFIAAKSSSLNGSVSSILWITSNTIFASGWKTIMQMQCNINSFILKLSTCHIIFKPYFACLCFV